MTHFGDNLYVGNAKLTPTGPSGQPSGFGIGPVGREYLWDTVPLALGAANIAASQTPAGAGNLTLTAGTGTTRVVNSRGEVVIQLDVPRAVSIFLTAAGTPRAYTVTGYDYTGQKMSEVITSVANATTNGKKAFFQILTISGAGSTAQPITVGTTDILGCPVAFPDKGYLIAIHYNGVQAVDAATTVVADTTSPATTTTGDVRGTLVPSSATDGAKRLIVAIGLSSAAAGINATRASAYGVDQNLGTT